MSMKLLFEIGTEEIPAKYMTKALAQLEDNAKKQLNEKRIQYSRIRAVGTPRRLTLLVDDIAERQTDLTDDVKGPAKKSAYDESGNPTKALLGFLRGQKAEIEDIEIRLLSGVEYVYVKKFQAGELSEEVLKTILPELITSFSFAKSMKWGNKTFRFARPIRWLLPMLDDKVLYFDKDGIACGNITRGHRVLSSGDIVINHVDEYFSKLKGAFVIVDQDVRKEIITQQCQELAQEVGGVLHMDSKLLEEVVFLVEYPTALIGSFEEEYLKLPKEVVITPMQEHQRYFPVLDKNNKLMNKFITVRNGGSEHLDIVREGNEKVLRARLADAKFFYNEDKKIPLDKCTEKLKTIVFQETLGTIYEKVERIKKISAYLAEAMNINEENKTFLQRAAHLCKADLVTGMVKEFDELQGLMGMEYALLQGENSAVAEAIVEHYLPRFAGDITPSTELGAILSISDKIDTIMGCFSIGIIPTGSQDPYALRRQAIGIITIMLDSKLNLGLGHLIEVAMKNFNDKGILKGEYLKIKHEILEFIRQRYKNVMIDRGNEYDVIDAVINSGFDNILEATMKIETLKDWKQREEFPSIVSTFNRVKNLATKAENSTFNENLLVLDQEKDLVRIFIGIESNFQEAIENCEYDRAMESIMILKKPIDDFFESVMIMVEDVELKNSRLGLLKSIAEMMYELGDLSAIVMN